MQAFDDTGSHDICRSLMNMLCWFIVSKVYLSAWNVNQFWILTEITLLRLNAVFRWLL